MEITITLSEEDQFLQAEILKVLLRAPLSDTTAKTGKPAESTKKRAPKAPSEPTPEPTPEPSAETSTEAPQEPAETPEEPTEPTTQPAAEKPAEEPSDPSSAISMADLRKSVNAISRKKGLNWLYSWLGELGVKSIADIPVARLEEANTKLQNYA